MEIVTANGIRRSELVKQHSIALYGSLCDIVGVNGVYNVAGLLSLRFIQASMDCFVEESDSNISKKEELIAILQTILMEKHIFRQAQGIVLNLDRAIHAQMLINQNVVIGDCNEKYHRS